MRSTASGSADAACIVLRSRARRLDAEQNQLGARAFGVEDSVALDEAQARGKKRHVDPRDQRMRQNDNIPVEVLVLQKELQPAGAGRVRILIKVVQKSEGREWQEE